MYKLVVLFAVVAVATAAPAPGLLAAVPVAHTAVVGSVDTISHHSNSVVHSAALAHPVVHAAPVVHAYAAPLAHSTIVTAPVAHGAVVAAPWSYGLHGLGVHGIHDSFLY